MKYSDVTPRVRYLSKDGGRCWDQRPGLAELPVAVVHGAPQQADARVDLEVPAQPEQREPPAQCFTVPLCTLIHTKRHHNEPKITEIVLPLI